MPNNSLKSVVFEELSLRDWCGEVYNSLYVWKHRLRVTLAHAKHDFIFRITKLT